MFISRKHLSRRTFLRGTGVTLALPFLEAMLPAHTALASAAVLPTTRFAGIFFPHGMAPGHWVPKAEGANFELPFIMEPLRPVLDRAVILSGLHARSAEPPQGVTGSDHFVAAAFLSAVKPKKTTGADINAGITIDQIIAEKIGQDTLLPSLQLAVEDPGASSSCGEGYSCAYTNSISWVNATTPLPTEINPRIAFERLFGDGTNADERLKRRKRSASVLDSVTHELSGFKKDLSAGDRQRLDDYTDNIRELERRINIATTRSIKEPSAEIPFGIPETNFTHFQLMYDLLALAFEGDITRSATLMLGRDLSGASFPESGFNGGWHGSSHHGDKPENVANYAKMNRYHVQHLANFVQKLNNMPEGDGTVLDHILIYKGSNMGNSHRHAHVKVPVVLVGGIDGTFKGNRHVVFPDDTEKTSNMLLSILHLFGIERESIGQSSHPLPGFA
jgi:hypothetical protein